LQIDKICKVAKKPMVVTYTGLIQTCIDSNNIENARYIFNQMQNFCAPNIVTCNVMLKLYKEHKMFDEAHGLFNEVISGKVVPNKFTFNTMMEACVENGKFEEFERVFLQMLHHGHHFDVQRHLKMVVEAFRAGKVLSFLYVLILIWILENSFCMIMAPLVIHNMFMLLD
jgi:pentatricopeptide repeat protein